MSEFPKSGTGSWAQWRRRAKNQGGFQIQIDNDDVLIDHPWWTDHLAHFGSGHHTGALDKPETAQAIADRRAG